MSNTIYHFHHIVPKHMGGTDDKSNLVKLTLEEHAEAHRKLYEEHGRWQDRLAWKGLSSQITQAEAHSVASSLSNKGKPKSKEQREKMSETHRKRWKENYSELRAIATDKMIDASRKKVCGNGKIYNSLTEAAKDQNVTIGAITLRCQGKNREWYYV